MLLEVVVMSVALVLAVRQSPFDDGLKTSLFYGGIAALAAVVGNAMRGHAASAFVMAPVAFALMAGAIQLIGYIDRRRAKRR